MARWTECTELVLGKPITILISSRLLTDQGLRFNAPRTGTRVLKVMPVVQPLATVAPRELRQARQRGLWRMAQWRP
jgi:hypothetical protein